MRSWISPGSSSKLKSLYSLNTSSPLSLNGVPSGNAPLVKLQMDVSRCFPSTTSRHPLLTSWKNIVGIGMFSMSDSTSFDAVFTVHTYSRW